MSDPHGRRGLGDWPSWDPPPEFIDPFAPQQPPAPLAPPYQPPPVPAPPAGTAGPYSGLAVGALAAAVVSLAAMCGFPIVVFVGGPAAIGLGIAGLVAIRRTGGRLRGKALAITGIAIGAILSLIALIATGAALAAWASVSSAGS